MPHFLQKDKRPRIFPIYYFNFAWTFPTTTHKSQNDLWTLVTSLPVQLWLSYQLTKYQPSSQGATYDMYFSLSLRSITLPLVTWKSKYSQLTILYPFLETPLSTSSANPGTCYTLHLSRPPATKLINPYPAVKIQKIWPYLLMCGPALSISLYAA